MQVLRTRAGQHWRREPRAEDPRWRPAL